MLTFTLLVSAVSAFNVAPMAVQQQPRLVAVSRTAPPEMVLSAGPVIGAAGAGIAGVVVVTKKVR